jgi:hypothetical protein
MNDDNSHAKADEHSGDAFEANDMVNDMVEEEDALEQHPPSVVNWRRTPPGGACNIPQRSRRVINASGRGWPLISMATPGEHPRFTKAPTRRLQRRSGTWIN